MGTKSIQVTLLRFVDLSYGVDRSVEFVSAFEGSDLCDENILEQVAALL